MWNWERITEKQLTVRQASPERAEVKNQVPSYAAADLHQKRVDSNKQNTLKRESWGTRPTARNHDTICSDQLKPNSRKFRRRPWDHPARWNAKRGLPTTPNRTPHSVYRRKKASRPSTKALTAQGEAKQKSRSSGRCRGRVPSWQEEGRRTPAWTKAGGMGRGFDL